ncbi:hypothetical protein PM082_011273 [Marasmius tenuissimus]|nr:hypothetical protein PM082_011273 [Marasmius tenuissimus]
MASKMSNVDVLVIGAGPAGLMAAFGLARAGVNVRIIDQRPAKVAAGQADGIQPRTIEVFQSYGLADRLLKEGNQMHMAVRHAPCMAKVLATQILIRRRSMVPGMVEE